MKFKSGYQTSLPRYFVYFLKTAGLAHISPSFCAALSAPPCPDLVTLLSPPLSLSLRCLHLLAQHRFPPLPSTRQITEALPPKEGTYQSVFENKGNYFSEWNFNFSW